MKLKSLRKSGFLTILLGIAFLTSATPTLAHNNLVFRSCLIQCLEEICQEYSPLCFQMSHSRVFYSVENLFCKGMPGTAYNPMAITTKPSCIIGLNDLKECQNSCLVGSN